MSRAVGVIKKLQLIFPKMILLTIYNALILPLINYCLLSWGSASAIKTIVMLQKEQFGLFPLLVIHVTPTLNRYINFIMF